MKIFGCVTVELLNCEMASKYKKDQILGKLRFYYFKRFANVCTIQGLLSLFMRVCV